MPDGALCFWRECRCIIWSFLREARKIIAIKQVISEKGGVVMAGENAKVCAVTDAKLLGKLTAEAEFSCARCGAKAHNKASVCDPVPLEPDH
jgi:hypothetical protein